MPKVAIVGMHRGGTSAAAGVVFHLGAYMGGDNMLTPSPHNPKGYFEDGRFVYVHNMMLGMNWFYPKGDNYWENTTTMNGYSDLLSEYGRHKFWAVKDPRLCYCLPYLLKREPGIKVIAVHRDPWYAAMSLARRDGMSLAQTLEISTRFLAKMYHHLDNFDISYTLVRYADLITKPDETVEKLADFIGVPATDDALLFPDPMLSHGEFEDIEELKKLL